MSARTTLSSSAACTHNAPMTLPDGYAAGSDPKTDASVISTLFGCTGI